MNTKTRSKAANEPDEFDRVPDGYPTIKHKESHVVYADALTLLSGVNFNSVEKVLAAQAMIAEFAGLDLPDLGNLAHFEDVPTVAVNPADPAFAVRADSTREFVEALAWNHDLPESVRAILRIRGRFPKR